MFLAITGENFRQEVLDASGLVLVSFWAPWCGACRWVNPLLHQFQAQVDTPLKIVSVNADNNFAIVNTYRLATLPTVLVFYQGQDRKSTRLNSSHIQKSRMPSSA